MEFTLDWWIKKKSPLNIEITESYFNFDGKVYQASNMVSVNYSKKYDDLVNMIILPLIGFMCISFGTFVGSGLLVFLGIVFTFLTFAALILYFKNMVTYFVDLTFSDSKNLQIVLKNKPMAEDIYKSLMVLFSKKPINRSYKLKKVKTKDGIKLVIVP